MSSLSFALVTITSIQTKTVYPTWFYTSSPNVASTAFVTVSTLLSADIAIPTTATSITFTSGTSRTSSTLTSMENLPSLPLQTWTTNISTMPLPPISPTARVSSETTSSTTSSATNSMISNPPNSTISSTSINSNSTSSNNPTKSSSVISNSTSKIQTTTPTPTKTPTMPSIGIATSASASASTSASTTPIITNTSTHSTSKRGLIIGIIFGGTAALIFTLLALLLYIRRRKEPTLPRRTLTKQRLLRGDSISSFYPSTPTTFTTPTLDTPILQPPRPNHTLPPASSNPDLSLDSMYLRRERERLQGIEPPSPVEFSRMASFYSTSSWDGGAGLEQYWDLERDLSKHDSRRSNPFDLEPPPSVHRVSAMLPMPWKI